MCKKKKKPCTDLAKRHSKEKNEFVGRELRRSIKKIQLRKNETRSSIKKAGGELFSACKGKEIFGCKLKLAHSGWRNMGNVLEASK